LQLRSLAATRQPTRDIVNQINLFYQRDWTSTESGAPAFNTVISGKNQTSINQHGERQKPDDFLFDLVRSDSMAADLVGFYIDRLSVPSTYYDFIAYLEQFDLERYDILSMNYEDFHRLRKIKMMIAAINRIFGSGKNNAINQVQITAEVLRYIWFEETVDDQLFAFDALTVSHGLDVDVDETVPIIDEVFSTHVLTFPESATVSDAFASLIDFNPTITEPVTAIETLTSDQSSPFEDSIKLLLDSEGWRHYGYGGGPYSYKGFGGYVIWRNRSPDESVVSDELFAEMTFGTFTETATIADQLGISSGFGTPIGSGYGLVPFGK
jgi:hypothetical protein